MRAARLTGDHRQLKYANGWRGTGKSAMLSLLADENLDGNIVRGVLRRVKGLNLARVQDLGLSG